MKTHLPKTLRTLLLAALVAVPFADYARANDRGPIPIVGNTEPVTHQGYVFSGNGGVISISSDTASGDGVLPILDNVSVSFISNHAERGNGGAIFVDGFLTAKDNDELIFQSNTSSLDGGSIFVQGDAALDGNGEVSFIGNNALSGDEASKYSSSGGAMHVEGSFSLSGNDALLFSGNNAGWTGGALSMEGANATMKILDNGNVTFENNATLSTGNSSYNRGGGAIALTTSYTSTFEMTGNRDVLFSGNKTTVDGGACLFRYANGGTALFGNNTSLTFEGNSALGNGGAVALSRNVSWLTLENIGELSFRNNTAGGYGGAISVDSQGDVSIINNGRVDFLGNSAVGSGGAIMLGVSDLTIAGNRGDVTFRGNSVRQLNDETGELENIVLSSVSRGASYGLSDVVLAAESGTTIGFYDAVDMYGLVTNKNIDLNQDEEGVTAGTILFSGKYAEEDLSALWKEAGWSAEGEAFAAALNASRQSVLSSGRVTLHGGTLAIEDGAGLTLNTYYGAQVLQGATVRLSNGAALALSVGARGAGLVMEEGSTLVVAGGEASRVEAPLFTMRGAALDYSSSLSGSALSVEGALTMEGASILYRSDASQGWGEGVAVSGALTTTGTTTVTFVSASGTSLVGTHTLFTCESYSGDLSDWVLQSGSVWGEGVLVNGTLTDASLVESTGVDGRAALLLTVTEANLPDEPTDVLHVPTGTHETITDLSRKVSMEGGELDATAVQEVLSNDAIRGNAGTVFTTETQLVQITGTENVGYGITGADAASRGAQLETGVAGGASASANVTLNGVSYDLSSLSVLSGQTTVGRDSIVGQRSDAVMTVSVGSEGGSASLTNNGSIYAKSVGVQEGSTMTNKGNLTSEEDIRLEAGSALRNEGFMTSETAVEVSGVLNNNGLVSGLVRVEDGGVVKGSGEIEELHLATGSFAGAIDATTQQVIDKLTVEEGATLGFYVQPTGQGASSSLSVGHLALDGNPDVVVRLGGQLTAANGQEFSFTLLEAEQVTGTGSLTRYLLSGMTQLVDEESLEMNWDAASGTLTFSGKLSLSAVTSAVAGDVSRLADTLWSSASNVAAFARVAASQTRWHGAKGVQFWAAGLGDFVNMGSEGGLSAFDYSGGGYAVGGNVRVAEGVIAGAAVGQMFGRHQTDDHLLRDKQRATMFSLHGSAEIPAGKTPLLLSADFAYGSVSHTADTHVGGDAATPGRAKWDDDVFTFGLQLERSFSLTERLALTPFAGVRYLYGGQESDIIETYEGGSRRFQGGSMQNWSIPAGVTLSGAYGVGSSQQLLPYLTVAYIGDVARREPKMSATAGGERLSVGGHTPGRNGLMVRTGLTWQLDESWAVGADYHLEVRSEQVSQDVNVHVNCHF